MYRPKHDGQPDGLTDDGYGRPAHSLIERLESQLGYFYQIGAMAWANQIGGAAVAGPGACDKLAPERGARTFTRHRDERTTEYGSDDFVDAEEDDVDSSLSAVRRRHSVEKDDVWLTEENNDDDVQNIYLPFSDNKRWTHRWRLLDQVGQWNRSPSMEDGDAFGTIGSVDEDWRPVSRLINNHDAKYQVSLFKFDFEDNSLQMPPGKHAYPRRRTSRYCSMPPSRFDLDDVGAEMSTARNGSDTRRIYSGSVHSRDDGRRRERPTDRQLWDQRQNEIVVREPVASEHSSSTARSRVVTRHSGAADGATTGERSLERTESITSTVRGRGRGRGQRPTVDQGDTNENRQYNFDRRDQTSEYETDRPGKRATSSLAEEQDERRLCTGYETDRQEGRSIGMTAR